jgi:hypothetical protein
MVGRNLCPEDREALRQIVSRSTLTWRQFRFLHGLIGSMSAAEQRDIAVMKRLAPRPTATILPFRPRKVG